MAGHLYYESRGDHLYLANIAIRPPFQRRGLGTAVTRMVMNEAANRGLRVRLQVMPSNPDAQRFYERLGFRATGRDDRHIFLEWIA